MHVHILGIGGTFMGGVAAIAKEAGHRVTGSDRNMYPPMSTQLEALGVEIVQGFEASQLDPLPDAIVIGNVITRGMPVTEALLDRGLPLLSGPEWLAREVLRDRWVLAVAGTHGKTTTTSILTWILEHAGLAPGFLIGGVPANFGASARLGGSPFFVIEADEYDTAFFDKRAKFVHYRPRTAILNNLEYDHADIYPDLGSIQRQFHHLVRTVPGSGRIVWNAGDANLAAAGAGGDFSTFEVLEDGVSRGTVRWQMIGAHNMENALAAIAAARHAGVPVEQSIEALKSFKGIARRMELRGEVSGVRVYDDFAHHPTAIQTTVDGLRRRVGKQRIIAVFEPRSATMKMGVHRESLGPSLEGADEVWLYAPPDLGWDISPIMSSLGKRGRTRQDIDTLAADIAAASREGDHVLIMSNGGFGGLHGKVLAALQAPRRA